MKNIDQIYPIVILLLFFCCCDNTTCRIEDNYSINIISSEPCNPTGIIEVKGFLPQNTRYKLNDGQFQSESIFKNIAPDIYKLTICQDDNCEVDHRIEVNTNKSGQLFSQVRIIFNTHCSKCHSAFNPQAGIDLTNDCHILNHWERIKARAIESNPSPMPPTGLIEKDEIQIISDWIRLGHSYHL